MHCYAPDGSTVLSVPKTNAVGPSPVKFTVDRSSDFVRDDKDHITAGWQHHQGNHKIQVTFMQRRQIMCLKIPPICNF